MRLYGSGTADLMVAENQALIAFEHAVVNQTKIDVLVTDRLAALMIRTKKFPQLQSDVDRLVAEAAVLRSRCAAERNRAREQLVATGQTLRYQYHDEHSKG